MFDWVLNTCRLPVKNKKLYQKIETLWPLFMDTVQLSQDYRTTMRRLKSSWYFLIGLGRGKNEFTLEQPSGFEHGTCGLGIERPCPVFINFKQTLHFKDYKVATE